MSVPGRGPRSPAGTREEALFHLQTRLQPNRNRRHAVLAPIFGGSIMSKPWHEKPLWWKVFVDANEVYLHAGKIIGHLGCSPFEFFDAAKLLPDYNQHRYEHAVRDLTVYAKREASPP